ncbi:MAG: biotin--[acetyl-CoA-carboxylase] ligase [Rectinemataceae bacterium]
MEMIPLRNPFAGAACFLVKETDSTMRDALGLARMGFPAGSLVAADFQTAGRGRFGDRRWESEPGANLLFTLRLAPEAAAIPAVPLRVGAVLCRTVVLYSIRKGIVLKARPFLKWPNDLLIRDRKAAGVLCESKPEGEEAGLYVGIGVNCNQTAFPAPIATASTSLAAELGAPVDRWLFLELFLDQLAGELAGDSWKAEVEDRLWRRGRPVRFLPALPAPDGVVEGLLEGVDDEGSLLLTLPGEGRARAFPSGELLAWSGAS